MAGMSACLPESETFGKARLLILTDCESPDVFLSLDDVDAIEAVSCNAYVEDLPSKTL